MRIKLSNEEVEVFKEALKFEMPGTLPHVLEKNNCFYIEDSEDKIIDYEQCCQEYLLYTGFDKDYNLTNKGEIIERLIDKIFIK